MKSSILARIPAQLQRARVAAYVFGLALVGLACNSDPSESFIIDGTWAGTVPAVEFEMTLILAGQGKDAIVGSAQVTAPPEGAVQGTVSGTMTGKDVDFTVEIDEVIVGGSVVFDGAFQGEDTLVGTLDSGILGGTFAVTLQRQGV